MKLLSCFGWLAVLSSVGCEAPTRPITPHMTALGHPPLDTEQKAELGDTVLSKVKFYSSPALILKNEISFGDGLLFRRFTIPPQTMLAKTEDDDWTYFYAKGATVYDVVLGTMDCNAGLKVSKTDTESIEMFASGATRPTTQLPQVTKVVSRVEMDDGFSQELIYNGRSEDTIQFVYRELHDSKTKPPFNQDIRHDLRESHTVGFKGARIEVIEATNTSLRYKVLHTFAGPE